MCFGGSKYFSVSFFTGAIFAALSPAAGLFMLALLALAFLARERSHGTCPLTYLTVIFYLRLAYLSVQL